MTQPTGNRRLDRVLSTEFIDDLKGRSLEDVRAARRDAEQEETDLSYLRRLLQGRLDILRAELARRGGGDQASLVDNLASILTDDATVGAPRGLGRHIISEPSRADSHRRYVEALVSDVDLSDPSSHDEASLRRVLELLEREERTVSENRKAVQSVMDVLTADITRRYRDGDADVAALLPTESA